jgi:hypothetical protein
MSSREKPDPAGPETFEPGRGRWTEEHKTELREGRGKKEWEKSYKC